MSETRSPDWSRWLPAAALASAVPTDPLAAALRDWSRRWLAHGVLTLSERWRPAGDRVGEGHLIAGELALALREGGETGLGEMMFGPPDAGGLDSADQRAIGDAVMQAMTDLRHDLASAIELGAPWSAGQPVGDSWIFAIDVLDDHRRNVGTVLAGRDLLVRRALAGASPARKRPVVRRAEALAAQPLVLGARIGVAKLLLQDLGSLSRDDVVLLDKAASDPVELTIDGRGVDQPCRMASASGALVLQIQ